MFLITTWERGHLGLPKHKKAGLKLSKYKADTFDMIQHALEENNMVKAIQSTRTFVGLKKKNVMCEQMCEQEKSTKTPQTVDTIISFPDQNRKASYMTTFDEFDNCYGAKYKDL